MPPFSISKVGTMNLRLCPFCLLHREGGKPTVHRKPRIGQIICPLSLSPYSAPIPSIPFNIRASWLYSQVTDVIKSLSWGKGRLGKGRTRRTKSWPLPQHAWVYSWATATFQSSLLFYHTLITLYFLDDRGDLLTCKNSPTHLQAEELSLSA